MGGVLRRGAPQDDEWGAPCTFVVLRHARSLFCATHVRHPVRLRSGQALSTHARHPERERRICYWNEEGTRFARGVKMNGVLRWRSE